MLRLKILSRYDWGGGLEHPYKIAWWKNPSEFSWIGSKPIIETSLSEMVTNLHQYWVLSDVNVDVTVKSLHTVSPSPHDGLLNSVLGS